LGILLQVAFYKNRQRLALTSHSPATQAWWKLSMTNLMLART
jgi:hypothetical protein